MAKLVLPWRPCAWAGCRELIQIGARCELHTRMAQQQADRYRGSAYRRGYDRDWQACRRMFLRRYPRCELCLARGLVRAAEEVHHRQRIAERPDLRLDASNLQALCKPCHSGITAAGRGQ